MQIKTIKKLLLALLTAAAVITTSCSNDLALAGTVKGDGITAGKTVELTITTTADYTLFPETKDTDRSAARTIVSDGYKASELTFYLFGENKTTGKALEPQVVTFTADKDGDTTLTRKGTASLQIGSYVWDLFIAACDSTDKPTGDSPSKTAVLEKAVLLGETTANLTGTNNTVSFVLTPDDLTKTGTVAMKIYTDGWDLPDGYKVNIKLTTRDNETELSATSPAIATASTAVSNLTNTNIKSALANAYTYAAGNAKITGGKYKFIIEFVATTGKTYYYSDDIIILPGKGNTSTLAIPYVIEVPPTAPTAFKVGYVEPTDDTTAFYSAVFEWKRSSTKTEKYYELELMQLGTPTVSTNTYSFITNVTNTSDTKTDDDSWDAQKGYAASSGDTTTVTRYAENESADGTTTENFYKNDKIWVAGSLMKASEFAEAKLNLGNRYNARIRAVNDAGESEWVYVAASAITADADAGKPAATKYTSTTMNLYRLTYDIPSTCTWTSGPADYITYNCESADGLAIKQPDGTVTADGTLKDGTEAIWTNWKDYNEPGVAPAKYKGFENLTLIPVFAKKASIEVYNDADWLIETSQITLNNSLSIANNSVTIDLGSITANDDGEKNITWTVDYDSKDYTSVYLTLAKTTSLSNCIYKDNIDKSNNTFTMNVAGLNGTYLATLYYTINGREYTTVVTLQISE